LAVGRCGGEGEQRTVLTLGSVTAHRIPTIERESEGGAMRFVSIFWDMDDDPRGNSMRCAPSASKKEVDEVLQHGTDQDVSRSSGFPVIFGRTQGGRCLMVVYEQVDEMAAYPITVYDVSEKVKQ
jgi:hypothetical protein